MIEVDVTAPTVVFPVIGKSRCSTDEGSRATRESLRRTSLEDRTSIKGLTCINADLRVLGGR
jgi:hypothetical protein